MVAAAAVLLTAACGQASHVATTTGYRLYEAAAREHGGMVAIIDTRSQVARDHLPLGTPSPDWRHYYTVSDGSLVDIDPQTGRTQSRMRLPGEFQLPAATNSGIPGGLSPNGRWLVLQRFDGSSHLLVIDTSSSTAPRPIELHGQFQFDAISNDGDRVYLIQYINGSDYHVRMYTMSSSALDPSFIVDKTNGDEAMTGLRLGGVASREGAWLFSVYARENKGAFIHALNLTGPYALCLDLPASADAGGVNSSLAWSLAISPDGSHVYASNPVLGIVVEIVAREPSITRVLNVGEPSHVWPAGAAVSADSRTLVFAGSTGIAFMSTITLKVEARALPDWTVRSLALSPDGKTLYAVNDRGVVAEVSMASHAVTATFDPRIDHPLALMRVEALG